MYFKPVDVADMQPCLTIGSLFSGIGALDYAFTRTGCFRTLWCVEANPFCRTILAEHDGSIPCYGDIQGVDGRDVAHVDVLIGGFPCTDISTAGKQKGIEEGEHSGLWREFARLIGEIRPCYVVVENVSALRSTSKRTGRVEPAGLARVLGDLSALRYNALWHCLPASAVGAPHRRDRIFIVAHNARGADSCYQAGEWRRGACRCRRFSNAFSVEMAETCKGVCLPYRQEQGAWEEMEKHLYASPSCGCTRGTRSRPLQPKQVGQPQEQSSSGSALGQCPQPSNARQSPWESRSNKASREESLERSDISEWEDDKSRNLRYARGGRGGICASCGQFMADTAEFGLLRHCALVNAHEQRLERPELLEQWDNVIARAGNAGCEDALADALSQRLAQRQALGRDTRTQCQTAERVRHAYRRQSVAESRLDRDVDGTADWMDATLWPARPGERQHFYEPPRTVEVKEAYHNERLKALGNAVVPQQASLIAMLVLALEERRLREEEAV